MRTIRLQVLSPGIGNQTLTPDLYQHRTIRAISTCHRSELRPKYLGNVEVRIVEGTTRTSEPFRTEIGQYLRKTIYLYTTFYSLSLHLTRGLRISQVSTEVFRYTARLMDSNISPLYVDMVIESLRVLTSSDNCVIYFDTLRLDPM